MSDIAGPVSAVFEGYLKKHKNATSLTIFIEYNKRYFSLNAKKCELIYHKNRKKSGKSSEIPLKEILAIRKRDDEEGKAKIESNTEWGYEFYVITTPRTYLFNAYSWNDREIWMKALCGMLEYKKQILESRGIILKDDEIELKNRPKDAHKYTLIDSDFDSEG
jgi:hypothetical protein